MSSENIEPFEVGEYVVLVVDHPDHNNELVVGDRGYICDAREPERPGVEFERHFDSGHTCSGRAQDFHGWYVYVSDIERVATREIDDNDVPEFSDLIIMLST